MACGAGSLLAALASCAALPRLDAVPESPTEQLRAASRKRAEVEKSSFTPCGI
jgi:hypothetical protein